MFHSLKMNEQYNKYNTQYFQLTCLDMQKKLTVLAVYVFFSSLYVKCVTYFFVTRCNNRGVTNVKKPITEYAAIMTGTFPVETISAQRNGWPMIPIILEVNEKICKRIQNFKNKFMQ